MIPHEWVGVRQVLVVQTADVETLVTTAPARRALRRALPKARITLLTSPAGSRITPLFQWVDEVFICPGPWQEALSPAMEGKLALVDAIRSRRFEAVVIFTDFFESPHPPAYVCYLAGIPIRLGQSKEFGGGVLSHEVRSCGEESCLVERHLFLLESAGFQIEKRPLEQKVPDGAPEKKP